MQKLKSDIITSFKNKRINVFVLFLLFAFVILIFTKLSKDYTNTVSFNIEKLNVPQENIILNDSVTLDITLKTHGFRWLKYYVSTPKIKIDFSKDVYKKDGVFVWNRSKSFLNNTQFDKQVELLSISPDTMRFRYGVNMVKKVPVILNTKLSFSPGYDMAGKLHTDPDSITVVGPNILVSEIEALETVALDIQDVREHVSETIALQLPKNTSDLKFSSKQVVVKGAVEKYTEGMLKIPVSVINTPKNTTIKYFPKSVSVSYYVSLSNFKTIATKDFEVVCDFEKMNENQSFLVPELAVFPETVKHLKIGQQRIEFIITK